MELYETRRRRRKAHWRTVRAGPGRSVERRVRIKATWVTIRIKLDPNPQLPLGFPDGGEKQGNKDD